MRRGRSGLRYAGAPALVAAIAAALLIGTPATSAPLADCVDSQVVPRIAELLVSQGAPGYTASAKLARGKETIVRAYLTTPTACTLTRKQAITPVSAKVEVSYSGTGPLTAPIQTTPSCGSPPGTCSNYAPLAGKLVATTAVSPTSDPFFVIPDFYLAPDPSTNTNEFNITFKLRITYNRTTAGGTTTLTTTGTETNAVTTVGVDRKTNALRVLVVPMGDPTSTNIQWSTAANTPSGSAEEILQNVMTNAARAFPVPSGATPRLTTSTTGGIRYVVSTALLDAKSLGLMSSGKFCANGGNWSTSLVTDSASPFFGHTLKGDLLQRLADYNQFNNPPADMVLGVADGAIAAKSTDTSPSGCDDGRAATPASGAAGQVAWVRVSRDSYPTPLQMELMHPFGIVRPSFSASFHSPNVEADGAGLNKGYNVLQRKVVAIATGALGVNDHSVMNYNTSTIPYTKDNTLLEPRDWKDALCDLGGVDSLTSLCTLSSALGTSEGVAANDAMYQVSGVLTSSGLRVTDGKLATGDADFPVGVVSGSSPLHLRLYSGDCPTPSTLLQDVPLATFGGEGHDELGEHVDVETIGDSFGALVPLSGAAAGATRAELVLNDESKFSASACDDAPDILSTTTTGQGTAAPGTIVRRFDFPVDGNGRAIAFDGTHLYATLASGTTVYKLATDGAQVSTFGVGETLGALAWNPTTGHLYGGDYTGDNQGNVYDIDPGNIVEGEAAKTTLFAFNEEANCIGGPNQLDGLEYRPTAGNLAISGDICDTVFFKKLNGDADGQFETDNNSGITTDGAGGLWLARLTQGNAEYTQLTHVDSAGTPIGDDLILAGYAAEDLAYDSVTFSPTCVVWMNQATFAQPRPEIRAVAVPCSGSSATGAVGVQTENARFVSLQFTCGDPNTIDDARPTFTVANGLVPGTQDAVIAPYTDELFCGESPGKIIASASNGWSSTGLTDPEATETVTGDAMDPTASIASPLNGAKFRRGEFVHYDGSAFDAFESAITGDGLKWFDDKPSSHQIGTGSSFDLKIAANAPLGDHLITLTATDGNGHSRSATVTITIGPALCPSTSNCP